MSSCTRSTPTVACTRPTTATTPPRCSCSCGGGWGSPSSASCGGAPARTAATVRWSRSDRARSGASRSGTGPPYGPGGRWQTTRSHESSASSSGTGRLRRGRAPIPTTGSAPRSPSAMRSIRSSRRSTTGPPAIGGGGPPPPPPRAPPAGARPGARGGAPRGRPSDRRTARDLRWCLAGHVREALGAKPVDAVRRGHVEALLAELGDDGVSERRCRAVAAAVRALYDDAVVRGLAHGNPASGVGLEEDAATPPAVGRGSERAISLVLRGATVGFLLLALVFLTESL